MDFSVLQLSALTIMGVATIVGFYSGHLARFVKLPSLIGYMVLGVILGPSVLHLLDAEHMESLSFITEVALGFVAFGIGAELSLPSLKRLGPGIISIIFVESFTAFFVVTAVIFAISRDLPLALIFGAMAPASAPAGTVAVIQECKAKGNLTKALYAVVGFDDGLAIIIFGFAAAVAKSLLMAEATGATSSILPALIVPAKEIGLSILIGGVLGFGFSLMVRKLHRPGEILVLIFGVVLLATGLSVQWHLSLIMTNLVIGFFLVNTRREALVHRVTSSMLNIMPLLFILFFCLAGAHLDLGALPKLGAIGCVYIIGRTTGLMGGARLGGMLGHVEENVKKYVGLGILSQAGVAIGLALIVMQDFTQMSVEENLPIVEKYGMSHMAWIGATVITTITATSIFFEILGPICTKIALSKAGEIPDDHAA